MRPAQEIENQTLDTIISRASGSGTVMVFELECISNAFRVLCNLRDPKCVLLYLEDEMKTFSDSKIMFI